jgi:hypothetical protein
MYGDSEDDLKQTLKMMAHDSFNRACGNKLDQAASMKSWISNDPRFAQYDPERLVTHFQERTSCGGKVELDDPFLRKGGQPRPGQSIGGRFRY